MPIEGLLPQEPQPPKPPLKFPVDEDLSDEEGKFHAGIVIKKGDSSGYLLTILYIGGNAQHLSLNFKDKEFPRLRDVDEVIEQNQKSNRGIGRNGIFDLVVSRIRAKIHDYLEPEEVK